MKVGDLVRFNDHGVPGRLYGVVTKVDDSHRQSTVDVLFPDNLKLNIWDRRLEVVNEINK
jgi:hypothetical protein